MNCVGAALKVLTVGLVQVTSPSWVRCPGRPRLLKRHFALGEQVVILSAFLMRLTSMPFRLPVGMIFSAESIRCRSGRSCWAG